MKNASLCSILLIAMSSFSLQAMLLASAEELFKACSTRPLDPIEKQLVIDAIKHHGVKSIRNAIDKSEPRQRLAVLKLNRKFYKDEAETNPMAKNIFDEITKIEDHAKKRSEKTMPYNYLGLGTRYFLKEKNQSVLIKAKLFNLQEVLALVNDYKE
jgi:hypothetical protein